MRKRAFFVLTCFLVMGFAVSGFAKPGDKYPTTPVTNHGKKWRIGYYEGGQYPNYQIILKDIILGLQDLGWLKVTFPQKKMNDRECWQWFSKNIQSDYLDFVADGFYAPGDFDADLRNRTQTAFIKRVKSQKDLDLVLALGTWAGQDLAIDDNTIPTLVASCSDPIHSGIVKSVDDSGRDNLHALIEPERYERQLRLFHNIIGFHRLGIVYEDSVEGATFAALKPVNAIAKERGFSVVSCNAPFNNVSLQEAEDLVVQCYKEIAPKVDAVYITEHRGVTINNLPNVLAPLYEQHLPTFSMLGSKQVKHGVLMSIAQATYEYEGRFYAEVMAKIFNGATPRDINQFWQAPQKIAMNLKVAEMIGYDPPVDIMMASDEIYETIAPPTE